MFNIFKMFDIYVTKMRSAEEKGKDFKKIQVKLRQVYKRVVKEGPY